MLLTHVILYLKYITNKPHLVEYINVRHNSHLRAKVCGVGWSLTSMGIYQILQGRTTLASAYVLNYLYVT